MEINEKRNTPKVHGQETKKTFTISRGSLTILTAMVIYSVVTLLTVETLKAQDKPIQIAPLTTEEKATEAPYLVPVKGGLESVFPDLPAGLNFGDSEETVIAKMGRQPDKKSNAGDSLYFLVFKATESHGFQAATLVFMFMNERFERLRIQYEYAAESLADQEVLSQTAKAFYDRFLPLLGQPKATKFDRPGKGGATEFYEWEEADDLIVLVEDGNRNDYYLLAITISPLAPKRLTAEEKAKAPKDAAEHYEPVPVKGGLESVFPDLPSGLNFGDSEEAVIEKVGRRPDERRYMSQKVYFLEYKATELHGFQYSTLTFTFVDEALESVEIELEYTFKSQEDKEAFRQKNRAFLDQFIPLLNKPAVTRIKGEMPKWGAKIVAEWEQENNRILLMEDGNRYNYVTLTISLGPSSPNRPYRDTVTGEKHYLNFNK